MREGRVKTLLFLCGIPFFCGDVLVCGSCFTAWTFILLWFDALRISVFPYCFSFSVREVSDTNSLFSSPPSVTCNNRLFRPSSNTPFRTHRYKQTKEYELQATRMGSANLRYKLQTEAAEERYRNARKAEHKLRKQLELMREWGGQARQLLEGVLPPQQRSADVNAFLRSWDALALVEKAADDVQGGAGSTSTSLDEGGNPRSTDVAKKQSVGESSRKRHDRPTSGALAQGGAAAVPDPTSDRHATKKTKTPRQPSSRRVPSPAAAKSGDAVAISPVASQPVWPRSSSLAVETVRSKPSQRLVSSKREAGKVRKKWQPLLINCI